MPASLRILADIMGAMGGSTVWSQVDDKVRHGGKLSDALSATQALPPMAVFLALRLAAMCARQALSALHGASHRAE